jgi:serine/threonine protein kinase
MASSIIYSSNATYSVVRTLSTDVSKRDFLCDFDASGQKVVVHATEIHEDSPAKPHAEICEFLSKITHPRIPGLLESFQAGSDFFKVFHYVEAITLSRFLSMRGPMPEEVARSVFLQLLDVVEFLHTSGAAHRNLNTETILINERHQIYVVGFSAATVSPLIGELVSKLHMSVFDPPESLRGKPSLGVYYDYWSLGVLLFSLICARCPWDGDTPEQVCREMMSGKVLKPPEMSVHAHDLLLSFLELEPLRRCSLQLARSHSWFSVEETRKRISSSRSIPTSLSSRLRKGGATPPPKPSALTWGG